MQQNQPIRHKFTSVEVKNEGPFRIICQNKENCYVMDKCAQWNQRQNMKYAAFLKKLSFIIEGKKHSKIWKLYEYMADFIRTRNIRQCKSHHQKLQKQFRSIRLILQFFQQKYPRFDLLLDEQINLLNQFINSKPELSGLFQPPFLFRRENPVGVKFHGETLTSYWRSIQANKQKRDFQIKPQDNLQQQWIACHRLFIQWATRLKNLVLEGGRT